MRENREVVGEKEWEEEIKTAEEDDNIKSYLHIQKEKDKKIVT